MRKINYIVVHCSATREDCRLTVESLRREHLRRGFGGIGYHYYIRRDGEVVSTRPVGQVGAHVRGTTNIPSVSAMKVDWPRTAVRRILVRRSSVRRCACLCPGSCTAFPMPASVGTATLAPT